jgi:ribosome biogenesis protein MAK21
MDAIKLDLSGLKDKVASKLQNGGKKDHKKDNKKVDRKRDDKKSKKPETARKDAPPKKFDSQKKSYNPEKKDSKLGDDIRREALELGATEDDLALIQGVSDDEGSEQEFEGANKNDESLKNDLSNFMKGIGLGSSGPLIVSEEIVEEEEGPAQDVDEEIEEEPEEEEEEEQLEEEEQEEEKPVKEQRNMPKKEDLPTHQRVDPSTILNTSRFLIEPRVDWYNIPLDLTHDAANLSKDQIDRLYQRGKEALEADNKIYYEEFSKTESQRRFLSQLLSDGTLSDKISTVTLLIQEAPVHNLKSFDMMVGLVNKKSRTSQLQSLNALADLLVNGLLPDRKLRYFKNQPLNMMLSMKQLALFYFEDFLKNFYFKIIQVLEKLSHDPITHVRLNVVNHVFDLLKAKPEQEVNLLRLGVNKIGDIDKKVSSKTSYLILLLEQAHPNMKKIIIDAVIDIVFKKNVDYHTKYYSVLTLNQTILTRREEGIANELVKTYFALLEKLLIESDPYQAEQKTDGKASKDNKYKNRNKNFKKGKKGGKSVKNVKTDEEVLEEKDSKLFSALLTGVNRAFPFSNLPMEIYSKHLDTMFRITHSSNFNTSVQALMLIFQITSAQKINADRFYRTLYESLLDSRLVSSSKQGIYLNLLFKALKQDTNIPRVMAFVKRIVQICYNWTNVGPIAGMFFLLMELEKDVPQIRNLAINTPVDYKYVDEEDDDDEEHFEDVKSDDEGNNTTENKEKLMELYDGRKRDPRFANASNSSLWEIGEFLNHYHPTVQLYAESLLTQQKQQKPDLGLFTLAHFLDRFVYRNAKQKPTTKGSSIMQPLGGTHTGSLLVKASNTISGEVPANTENWLEKKTEEVRPDERFFMEYFQSKQKDPSRLNEPRDEDYDQESDLDDEEVWDALVKSQPDIEGDASDIDDFSDLDMSDFSDEDGDEGELNDEELDVELEAEEGGEIDDINEEIEEDAESGSEIELQTIGMSDEEGSELESSTEEPDFAGFSESDDEEAQLFKTDSEDEVSSEEEEEEEEEEQKPKKGKKRSAEESSSKNNKSKKAKLKSLPLFADADEYAKLLDSDDEN